MRHGNGVFTVLRHCFASYKAVHGVSSFSTQVDLNDKANDLDCEMIMHVKVENNSSDLYMIDVNRACFLKVIASID